MIKWGGWFDKLKRIDKDKWVCIRIIKLKYVD